MRMRASLFLIGAAAVAAPTFAQTFRRLGGCPRLGCIFPPDQADFLPNVYFDIRVEIHAPTNGTQAYNNGVPDDIFTFCVSEGDGECVDAAKFFVVKEPPLEHWDFSWREDLFAKDAGTPVIVNVASKAYRKLSFKKSGHYTARLKYYKAQETIARWTVRESHGVRKAKNVILFIGDGMTQAMITAARLIAHKSINGKYQSLMQLDQMDNLGLQMTHSMDSFITDSANSATALYTGHKSSVNALSVYADSSKNSFDDPKVETIAELFRRRIGGPIGLVSTAYIADATPAALCSHTRDRGQYAAIVAEYLNGPLSLNGSFPWTKGCEGPDVIFGGGAEQFIAGPGSPNGANFYKAFEDQGYNVVYDKTGLKATDDSTKTLGIFSISNMAKWLDREVFPENLKGHRDSPRGDSTSATDQPGLKEMTLKAVEILHKRSLEKQTGWFLMSEAASIDKMMHALDYDRALGELLELDDTVRATIGYLRMIGEYDDTLIVVTADHGHGFDVYGSVDTVYLAAQDDDRHKRAAIGVYANSGLPEFTVEPGSLPDNQTIVEGPQGPGFPVQWTPRYTLAKGLGAFPDHNEAHVVNTTSVRVPAVEDDGAFYANPTDQPDGYLINGTLAVEEAVGVHSLQDVPVYANGPGSESFRGVYNSVDIFFKIAIALGLGG